jgi:hypothetical protein
VGIYNKKEIHLGWGDNSVGQLGIGSTTRQAYAVKNK